MEYVTSDERSSNSAMNVTAKAFKANSLGCWDVARYTGSVYLDPGVAEE